MKSVVTCIVMLTCVAASAAAQSSATIEATFDRWNYPFNVTPGSRLTGSTFGAVLNPSFDDHDAQLILGFDTGSAGIPADNVEILSLSVELTIASDGTFEYDPSYDSFASYLDPTTDVDTGRPVELYGVGLRNGFFFPAFGPTVPGPIAFEEGEAYVFGNPATEGVRNAYMTDGTLIDGSLRDVSNNVAEGFDVTPWAVGNIDGLTPGDIAPLDSRMHFDVDLSDTNIASYIDRGLRSGSGGLFFSIASMHTAIQGSPDGVPSFYLGDPNLPDLDLPVASLDIEYRVIPEPSSCIGLVLGCSGLLLIRARRNAASRGVVRP